MKQLCMLLIFALLLGCLAGCASVRTDVLPSETAPSAPTENDPKETEALETDAPAEVLPDFTAQTVDGEPFTLSDALRSHDLVLINLFATWCPPCKMEFPYLEEAWEQSKDRVSVIALSIEPEDTDEMLRDYADEMGLTFPVGHEDGTDLLRFVTVGIPTTLLVDRDGRVLAVEIGAKTSTQDFLDLFDTYLPAGGAPEVNAETNELPLLTPPQTPEQTPMPSAAQETVEQTDVSVGEGSEPVTENNGDCTYAVCAERSDNGEGLAGVIVSFCDDASCTPVTTGADGTAVFTGPAAKYHVEIVVIPEGWEAAGETDFYTDTYSQTFRIPFREVSG